MAKTRLLQFNRQLKLIITPQLVDHGFKPYSQRNFRRQIKHDGTSTTQVIHFQVGQKGGVIGRFTVNLGVYNPDLRPQSVPREDEQPDITDCMSDLTQRLGFFHQPSTTLLMRLFRRPPLEPYDYWWEQSLDKSKMAITMQAVTEYLMQHGIPWLDSRTNKIAFEWANNELARRKEWIKQCKEWNERSSKSDEIPHYEPFPFPCET